MAPPTTGPGHSSRAGQGVRGPRGGKFPGPRGLAVTGAGGRGGVRAGRSPPQPPSGREAPPSAGVGVSPRGSPPGGPPRAERPSAEAPGDPSPCWAGGLVRPPRPSQRALPLLPLHPHCREGGVSTLPCPLPSVTPILAEHGGFRVSLSPFPGDSRGAAEPRHAGFTLFRQDKGTRATHVLLASLLAQWLVGPCAALKSFLNRKADTFSRSTLSAHFPRLG